MKVEAGQLRQWKAEVAVLSDDSGGSVFLVLDQHRVWAQVPYWRVLRPAGDTKLWSESRIEGWSEVVGEEG